MDFNKLKQSFLLAIATSLQGLPNFGVVAKNLSRSAQPNAVGFTHLKEMNVDVIFKLNDDKAYSLKKEEQEFGRVVKNYPLNTMEVTKEEAIKIANDLQDELDKNHKVHVHCTKGMDRTGLVIGAWKMLHQKQSYAQIKKDWDQHGTPMPHIIGVLKEINLKTLN